MGANSAIEWTDHTFNPWWGCVQISPGCKNCYAETFAHRLGRKVWGAQAERRLFGDAHWNEPRKRDRAAAEAGERRRVFCASMADVFEDRRDLDEQRLRLFDLIVETPHLDWLLLTKRPENMWRLAPVAWAVRWPSNVWAGTTVEDQQRADERIPHLLRVPAAVRFLSVEPLLGPVDLRPWLRLSRFKEDYDELVAKSPGGEASLPTHLRWNGVLPPCLHWVIGGGESGHGARVFDLAHWRAIHGWCRLAGVAPFFKQAGAVCIDSDTGSMAPLRLKSKKGGDLDEIKAALRAPSYAECLVREFPTVAR